MVGILSLVIAIGLGSIFYKLEPSIVKQFQEIQSPKRWPIYSLPIINLILLLPIQKVGDNLILQLGWKVLIGLLIFLACFDIKYMILPTKIIYIAFILGSVLIGIEAFLIKNGFIIIDALVGALLGYGLFMLAFYGSKWLLKKEGLGYGDVRIMGLIGLCVGVEGLSLCMMIASLLAIIVGGILYFIRKENRAFAFGPFLCIGGVSLLLFYRTIMEVYMKALGV